MARLARVVVAHCGTTPSAAMLEMERWRNRWTPEEWAVFLAFAESPVEVTKLRRSTYTGRPLGKPEFVMALEKSTSRRLALRKPGRRKNTAGDQALMNAVVLAKNWGMFRLSPNFP